MKTRKINFKRSGTVEVSGYGIGLIMPYPGGYRFHWSGILRSGVALGLMKREMGLELSYEAPKLADLKATVREELTPRLTPLIELCEEMDARRASRPAVNQEALAAIERVLSALTGRTS